MRPQFLIAALAGASLATPLAAEAPALAISAQTADRSAPASQSLAAFAPAADRREHRIDYEHWDEALSWLVVPMGPSIRQGAPTVEPLLGTRRIYGHTSRYRLEGNRVAFSLVPPEMKQALTDYRKDLERIGSDLDITRLPRNEQLAFWLNLHNVAVVEALAYAVPLRQPQDGEFGSNEAGLQDAKLVTIAGVELSPRDIREKIVYPNWEDPKVIYGFWRGEIGGPSLQRLAFNGANVDALLALSGEEFVNSLRGVERFSGALQVSKIYEEAAGFYFDDFNALRAHLDQFAGEDVKALIARTDETRYNRYEGDIADLSYGRRDPALTAFTHLVDPVGGDRTFRSYSPTGGFLNTGSRINPAIQRLINERAIKLRIAQRRGIRAGMVIYGDGQYVEGETPPEVQ